MVGSKEVFVDPSRDESLIFELLDFKHDVGDNGSAVWFLQDLATEQNAEGSVVILLLLYCIFLSPCLMPALSAVSLISKY